MQQKLSSQELLLEDNKKKLKIFKDHCEEKDIEISNLQLKLEGLENEMFALNSKVKQSEQQTL